MQLGFHVVTSVEEQLDRYKDLAKDQQGEDSWLVARWDPQNHRVVFGCSWCFAAVDKGIIKPPHRYRDPAKSTSFIHYNVFKDVKRGIGVHLNSNTHKRISDLDPLRGVRAALRDHERQHKLWVDKARIACKTLMMLNRNICNESLADVMEVGDIVMITERATRAHYNSCLDFVKCLLTLRRAAKSEHDMKSSQQLYSTGVPAAVGNLGQRRFTS